MYSTERDAAGMISAKCFFPDESADASRRKSADLKESYHDPITYMNHIPISQLSQKGNKSTHDTSRISRMDVETERKEFKDELVDEVPTGEDFLNKSWESMDDRDRGLDFQNLSSIKSKKAQEAPNDSIDNLFAGLIRTPKNMNFEIVEEQGMKDLKHLLEDVMGDSQASNSRNNALTNIQAKSEHSRTTSRKPLSSKSNYTERSNDGARNDILKDDANPIRPFEDVQQHDHASILQDVAHERSAGGCTEHMKSNRMDLEPSSSPPALNLQNAYKYRIDEHEARTTHIPPFKPSKDELAAISMPASARNDYKHAPAEASKQQPSSSSKGTVSRIKGVKKKQEVEEGAYRGRDDEIIKIVERNGKLIVKLKDETMEPKKRREEETGEGGESVKSLKRETYSSHSSSSSNSTLVKNKLVFVTRRTVFSHINKS